MNVKFFPAHYIIRLISIALGVVLFLSSISKLIYFDNVIYYFSQIRFFPNSGFLILLSSSLLISAELFLGFVLIREQQHVRAHCICAFLFAVFLIYQIADKYINLSMLGQSCPCFGPVTDSKENSMVEILRNVIFLSMAVISLIYHKRHAKEQSAG